MIVHPRGGVNTRMRSSPLLLPLLSAVRGVRALHAGHPLASLRPSVVGQHQLLRRRRDALRGGAGLWTWGFPVLSTSASPPDAPEPGNIFARILRGEAPAEVLEDGDELFSFVDAKPASRRHYLVIPKERYIRDASRLEASDAALVERMRRKAVALVRAAEGDAFDARELALGFHWPPWYSVPWLHLLAIHTLPSHPALHTLPSHPSLHTSPFTPLPSHPSLHTP